MSQLPPGSQNYLKVVWGLQEWSDDPVTTSGLAAALGVRKSTASDAVRKLSDQGLLDHAPYGAVSLTEEGRHHAVAMVRRHRLIETFLVTVLGYRWDQVHDEAETLEHAVSDFMVERIDEQLGHPSRDPHGDPIPARDGTVVMPQATLLAELGAGHRARVERVSDDDPELLQFLADHGIGVGTDLDLRPGAPYSGAVDVLVVGSTTPVSLGQQALEAIWAARLDA